MKQAIRMNPNDAAAQRLFGTIRSQHAEIALARDDRGGDSIARCQ